MHSLQTAVKVEARLGHAARTLRRVVIVGGHERSVRRLMQQGPSNGWIIESHTGDIGGRGIEELRAAIGRADIVVISTRINSHGSMFVAKDWARRLGRPAIILRGTGLKELEGAVAQIGSALQGCR